MDTLHCPQYKYYINVFPLRHLGSRKHSFDFTGLCASLCNQSMHRVFLNDKSQPVKLNLNKKLYHKQKIIQAFNIDA